MFRIIIVGILTFFMSTAQSEYMEWDKGRAEPPELTPEVIVLANAELEPDVVEKTKSVTWSQYETAKKSGGLAELQLVYKVARDRNVKSNLFAKQLYVEKEFDGFSLYLLGFAEQGFTSGYVGVAKQFGDLQAGVGIGSARYAEQSHAVVNPWLYYSSDEIAAFLSVERYKDPASPWFYKGYAEYKLGETISLGFYGEKGIGAGPMVRVKLTDELKFWVAKPFFSQPKNKEERTRLLIGVTFEIKF